MTNGWSLVYDSFKPEKEGLREALCTLGNGFFATRGAGAETHADDVHYPGTYLAGGYNRLQTEIAGRVIENEDLVNMPNWLPLTFRVDGGPWFDLRDVEILSYRQELDLKQGLLFRTVNFRDAEGRTTMLHSCRLVHMENPHLAGIQATILAQDWSGTLEIHSAIDAAVTNTGVERYRDLASKHLDLVESRAIDEESVFIKVRTNQSALEVALVARTQVFRDSTLLDEVPRETTRELGGAIIGQLIRVELQEAEAVRVEKTVSLYTSRDNAISEVGLAARQLIANAARFDELSRSHVVTWRHLWHQFDIALCSESTAALHDPALVLRLHIFHLLQTVSANTMDLDVGVPARGWHGEAYRGHVFWDELFIFPLLNLRMPEITRSLLMYRFRRLNAARDAAREAGCRGAMYPWQSGSDGREETQKLHLNPLSGTWSPDNTHLQRHVSANIAYNVWQYFQVTEDKEFLSSFGGEMILEIARFWASITSYNEDLDRYEICGVMGPDEYHDAYPDAQEPGLHNNAYTNVMAVWVLCRALETLEVLPELRRQELQDRLRLEEEELDRWRRVSRKMRLTFHGADGAIISQFEGYEALEEFDWEGYRKKYGNIQRLDRILDAEGDNTNKYKVSKQADVLMLIYLFSQAELEDLFNGLGYELSAEQLQENIRYYLARTSHGSTLSRVVHSWVVSEVDQVHAWDLFTEALRSDIADIQGGTTPEGIHLGAMAGTVDLVQRGFTGLELREGVLWFNPRLPRGLTMLHQDLRYRGHAIAITLTPKTLQLTVRESTAHPIKIGIGDQVVEVRAAESREFTY